MSFPSAFSDEQLASYLAYIQLPAQYHPQAQRKRDYEMLHAVQVYQLAAIPYENLLLHYSITRNVSIAPQVLYDKFINSKRGRGGYCMENCIFFNHILRKLGFEAYTTGARIRLREGGIPVGDYVGWMHTVNIVILADGSRYMVDVSFGGDGPTLPLPLVEGQICSNIGTQQLRLSWEALPGQISTTSKSWVYQYRNSIEKPWNGYYSFNEIEWLPPDFIGPNYFVSKHEESFQRHNMLIVKFLRNGNRIIGKRMLAGNVIKENMGGKTAVLKTCETEAERVQALKELFGIELTEEEAASINGYRTQLLS